MRSCTHAQVFPPEIFGSLLPLLEDKIEEELAGAEDDDFDGGRSVTSRGTSASSSTFGTLKKMTSTLKRPKRTDNEVRVAPWLARATPLGAVHCCRPITSPCGLPPRGARPSQLFKAFKASHQPSSLTGQKSSSLMSPPQVAPAGSVTYTSVTPASDPTVE